MLNEWEILSFIAAGFELLGLLLLGMKKKIGFISNIGGGLLWILFAYLSSEARGLYLVCPTAVLLNIKGYLFWRKNESNSNLSVWV